MERLNTVFVGRKPTLNYVPACMTLFKGHREGDRIKILDHGINRAMDVVEMLKNRLMPDVGVMDISIYTEHLDRKSGETSNDSIIGIKP